MATASELGRALNRLRQAALTAAERSAAARHAAQARWAKRKRRKKLVAALILALVLPAGQGLLPAGQAEAHPGRLAADGCHAVTEDYLYRSGKVAVAGSRHCHRLATGRPAILDGSEVLHGDDEIPCDKRQRAALERAEQGLDPNADAALVGAARQIVQDALASCP